MSDLEFNTTVCFIYVFLCRRTNSNSQCQSIIFSQVFMKTLNNTWLHSNSGSTDSDSYSLTFYQSDWFIHCPLVFFLKLGKLFFSLFNNIFQAKPFQISLWNQTSWDMFTKGHISKCPRIPSSTNLDFYWEKLLGWFLHKIDMWLVAENYTFN